jgi:hypothetical protein
MIPLSHHAFKHSHTSILLSTSELRSAVIIFFAELKIRSHSPDIAGIASLSSVSWVKKKKVVEKEKKKKGGQGRK